MKTKRFALIGAAGYVAPRHMKAIKELGHELVAAMDPHDSVGILDQYFLGTDFFTEIERFDRHLDKLRRQGKGIDYFGGLFAKLLARCPYSVWVKIGSGCDL